jgi:putative transcriptional regulator
MNKRTRLAVCWRWAALAVLGAALAGAARAQYVTQPAPGVLLVAADQMADPRFSHSVVLLIQHDESGSWGVIINKPTGVNVGEVVPALQNSGSSSKVYFGGPVEVTHLLCLYRDPADRSDPGVGLPGVHWSASEKALEAHLGTPGKLRVYAGYAGWAPGQLEFEIAHGGWKMVQGSGGNVFSDDPEGLWQSLTGGLSGIPI